MSYVLYIVGNGRKSYLERTIASWETNLKENPKHKIIFDDSGNKEYVEWLTKKFGDRFSIVSTGPESIGHPKTMQLIFKYLKKFRVDYFLQVEEDWILHRSVSIEQIIKTLEDNQDILQMRIPRSTWYGAGDLLDMEGGSLLLYSINSPNTKHKVIKKKWYSWRGEFYFWSHNPSVFNRKILYEGYKFEELDHEFQFGKALFDKYPDCSVGFWADNPYDAYVSHIGIKNKFLESSLPEHPSRLVEN